MLTREHIRLVLKVVAGLNFEQRLLKLMDMEQIDRADVREHSFGVAEYSGQLARWVGFSESDVEVIRTAARWHDIGKLTTPHSVLRKPGRLDDKEREIIKEHTRAGEKLLGDDAPKIFRDVILYHHERYDGKGYEGLKGEDIPIEARIVTIADTHDALIKARDYKPGMQEVEALKLMTEDNPSPKFGRRGFDPYLLRAFVGMRLLEIAPKISDLDRGTLSAFAKSNPMSDFRNGRDDNDGWVIKATGHRLKYEFNEKNQMRLVKMLCNKGTTQIFENSLEDRVNPKRRFM